VNLPAKTLIVIAGPTAVGKTSLAIQLAKKFQTEIISADSRQFFKELNIGTAKPAEKELLEVKHHFINSLSIKQDYDAAQFGRDAMELIHHLFREHDVVVMCGGSGLYIKAVTEGFDAIPEIPGEIRESLTNGYSENGLLWLQKKMKELDPELFATIDQQNPQRLMRALEVRMGTGSSIAAFRKKEKRKLDFNILKIGLELPREELYARIDERMDTMISNGLFEEAEKLYPYRNQNALQTVGYQEIFDFMDGQYDRDEAIRLLKRNSRRYAKRQMTWFKRDGEVKWFTAADMTGILQYITAGVATLKD
jgi:tRNA dimethylallyltransferase